MWKHFLLFELRYQLRQPLVWMLFLVYFLLAVALSSSEVGTTLGQAPGTALRNAPVLVVRLMPVLSLLAVFAISALVASAALRDHDRQCHMLFLTKPVRRLDYLGGRFAGAMLVSSLVLLAAVLGMVLGCLAPWQPAGRVGPVTAAPYLFGATVLLLPNLLVFGALSFALAIWSRRITPTYLGAVFFIGMQDLVEIVAQGMESRLLGSMFEPSGLVALETSARYWTLAEQASRMPELDGPLLANRLLWLTLAAVVLVAAVARSPLEEATTRRRGRARWRLWPAKGLRRGEATALETSWQQGSTEPSPSLAGSVGRDDGPVTEPLLAPAEPQLSGLGASVPGSSGLGVSANNAAAIDPSAQTLRLQWRQLLRQTRLEISEVVAQPPFLVLLAVGMMFILAFGFSVGSHEGQAAHPLTHLMLQAVQLGARLTLVVILVVYAAELVFSQRQLRMSQVYDALPVSSWVMLGAKFLALLWIVAVFLLVGALGTAAIQLAKGGVQIQPWLYLQGLLWIALPLVPIVVLALFAQTLSSRKLWGLLVVCSILLLRFALPRVGFENNLLVYGSHPPLKYSTFNGYGHQLQPFLAYVAYWLCASLVLGALCLLLWPRGTESGLRARWQLARERLGRTGLARMVLGPVGLASLGLAGMLATAVWILHHWQAGGGYQDRGRIIQRLASYETEYGVYRDLPLPRVRSVFAEVDIFPQQRQVQIRGRYQLHNDSDQSLSLLPLTISPRWVEGVLRVYGGVLLTELDLPAYRPVVEDPELGFYVLELSQPLLPGQQLELGFTVEVDHQHFSNSRHNDLVVANGTFFSNRNFLPVIGYSSNNELQNPREREKRSMGPGQRVPILEAGKAVPRNYLHADWIEFEAILSTSEEQVAITTGKLLREWSEGGRRYFHYRSEQPVVNLLPFLSGQYEVLRERWQDVEIEIYYHPDHAFNLQRFMEVSKQTLATMSESLGAYPHEQLRIVEIPNYHGKVAFAFSQVIPFSESWGFAADLEAGGPDWLAAVLSHEVAHQWWNHQVVPGEAQGATLIAEALPQYAALVVLDEMEGQEMVRRILKFHLDRYLQQRGREQQREMPLALVENQGYVHYNKGTLAFYHLEDQIGREALLRALRRLVKEQAFQGPPYATSHDLLRQLREEVPADKGHLIEDLFETITVYDNHLRAATYQQLPDGRYQVDFHTSSAKLRDDGLGNTRPVAMDEWVELGVFGKNPDEARDGDEVLTLEPRRLRSGDGRFSLIVDQKPIRAGIDPHHKLIDRDTADNLRPVVEARTLHEDSRAGSAPSQASPQ